MIPCFTGEEGEAQRGLETCPWSHDGEAVWLWSTCFFFFFFSNKVTSSSPR